MFINQIKKEGVQDYIFSEFQLKSAIDFNNLSKLDSTSASVNFARKMNFIKEEEDIKEINRKAFLYEKLDKDDIMNRLELMEPNNMYVIHHSLAHKKLKETNPEVFKTEKWYNKEFGVEELTEEQIDKLKKIQIEDGVKMGNAPPNTFLPKKLELNKASELSGKPGKVFSDVNSEIYFKQDDQFDQPLVELRCKINTNDCDFPNTTESLLFSMMWVNMLNENHRELNYMASLAGIKSGISVAPDHLLFTLSSYNNSVENFVSAFFKSL